jgi:hypothetical protein
MAKQAGESLQIDSYWKNPHISPLRKLDLGDTPKALLEVAGSNELRRSRGKGSQGT